MKTCFMVYGFLKYWICHHVGSINSVDKIKPTQLAHQCCNKYHTMWEHQTIQQSKWWTEYIQVPLIQYLHCTTIGNNQK